MCFPPVSRNMQSPGDVRIDESIFPPASQALSCTFVRWGARRLWWYQEHPPGGTEVFSYNEPAAFAELWHYLSFRDLQPWIFEGCLDDGYPIGLIFSNKDYIDSVRNAELLRRLISVYQAEDRQLLFDFASRRLTMLSDFVPTPLESQAAATARRTLLLDLAPPRVDTRMSPPEGLRLPGEQNGSFMLLQTRFPSNDCVRCTADGRHCIWLQWALPCFRCLFIGNRDCCYLKFDLWSEEYIRGRELNPSGSSGARQRLDDQYFAQCRPVFNQVFDADLMSKGDEVIRHVLSGCTDVKELFVIIQNCVELRRPSSVVDLLRERLDVLCTRHGLVLPANMRL
ncbi:hypothetical protein DFH06DRAFT_1317676 [Mycena polygramma]|nr:hypothetical protein DFH06DRAFT_1349430 [Mycena polygramma]KAJ7677081.1 hypothetical protein DFH06DRAFT_1317676 [Mycena polygramma]